MPVNEKDFALLQDEVKCLRKKFGSFLSTSGGYVNGPTTIPDSGVYPTETVANCGCAHTQIVPSQFGSCPREEEPDDIPLGDFATPTNLGAFFIFSAVDGIYYKSPDEEDWISRNTGLSDLTLEHGAVDPWWFKKNTPNEDGVILWRVGDGKALRSPNAGKSNWDTRTPSLPTGVTDVTFVQVAGDYFKVNKIYLLAKTNVAPYRTWFVQSLDDGFNWTWLELTTYNGAASRLPIWMAVNGTTGALAWVTTWADNSLRLMKINNDDVPTISAEYTLGNATQWQMENKYFTASPACALDSTDEVWVYGRMNNPQSLGLTHVIKSSNAGTSFTSVKNDLDLDWVGSMRVGMGSGGSRNIYGVRNVRTQGTAEIMWGSNTFEFSEEVSIND